MRPRHQAPVLAAILLAAVAGRTAADTATLDLLPGRLPWAAATVGGNHPPRAAALPLAPGLVDVDGDGLPELVLADRTKLLAFELDHGTLKPRWQHNLDAGWSLDPGAVALGATLDLDGDGVREIPYTAVRDDRGAWRYRVFDPATGSVTVDAPLPVFDGPRREPWWDGCYHVAGVLDDADGQGTRAVVLQREVMYDAWPRGLVAVDAAGGGILWQWECGPNPVPGTLTVTDLEGDGRQEIVVYGGAPGNLGGRLVNGTSDDRARLFVVSDRGRLLVDRVLGPERFGGSLRVADLDGDGRREIVSYSRNGSPGVDNVLAVWDGPTGDALAQVRGGAGFLGLAVLPGPRAGTGWLVTGSENGAVRRLLYADRTLREDRRLVSDIDYCGVVGEAAALPGEGVAVLVDVGAGATLAVLDRQLRTRAVAAGPVESAVRMAAPWGGPAGALVVVGDSDWQVLRWVRRSPWAVHGARLGRPALGAAALLATFAAGLELGRRRRRPGWAPRAAATPDRHRLRTVLQDLQETGHGTLGVTKGLRRVVMLATAGGGLGEPAVRERFTHLSAEVKESVVDRLRGILAAAGAEGIPTGTTAAALERCADRLAALLVEPDPGTEALTGLRRDQEAVEAGFVQLKREVEAYFTADPARMLRGMLLVREADLARAGVTASLQAPPAAPCLVDANDLRFVLDNLLDNAVRAMADAPRRILAVAVVPAGRDVVVSVADSGPGVPPDRREQVFGGRQGSRRGGGLGLVRSRELLARWQAEIVLDTTATGPGAVFRVTLRAQ